MSMVTRPFIPVITVEDKDVDHSLQASSLVYTDDTELKYQIDQYSTAIDRMHQLQRRSLTRMKPKALEFTFVQISSLTEQTQKLSATIKAQLRGFQNGKLLEEFRSLVHRHRQAQIFFYQEYRIYEFNRTIQLLQSGQNINHLTTLLMQLDGKDTVVSLECSGQENDDVEEEDETMACSYISFEPFESEGVPEHTRKRAKWIMGCALLFLVGFWVLLDENVGMIGVTLLS